MSVVVIGGGVMGNGIAQLCAMKGRHARLVDVGPDELARAEGAIRHSLKRFAKAGKLESDSIEDVVERIEFTTNLQAAVLGAQVVIEAVPEIADLKRDVLSEVIKHAPREALLGTNTSQLSITRLAASLGDQASRLVGIHFFNPPVMMRLVEVIAGLQTRSEEVDRAVRFAEELDREVVVCRKDSPGFITSRAYAILRLECVRMLEEGVASAEDIDKAMRLGFNFPVGPLELGDMNGLDTFVHALDGLSAAYGERFRPTVSLRNMIAAKRLGRKTGAGFYEYPDEVSDPQA